MKIGFDLDRIFVNNPPFVPTQLIDRLYKLKEGEILLYRFPSKPEQLLRTITHFPLFRPPMKTNIQFLEQIEKDKHQLYLISSRFGFLKKRTSTLMKNYKLDTFFDQLFFNFENKQPHIFKNEVLQRLHLDMYVDDDLALLKYLQKNNPNTKLYWLNKKETKQMSNNLWAIKDLKEIFIQP